MGPYDYVIENMNGDYANLRRTDLEDPGEPMLVAMALLPAGADIGTRLRWENFAYSILET